MNRRIRNRTYGGVRGRRVKALLLLYGIDPVPRHITIKFEFEKIFPG
jgi:hypothetical protein